MPPAYTSQQRTLMARFSSVTSASSTVAAKVSLLCNFLLVIFVFKEVGVEMRGPFFPPQPMRFREGVWKKKGVEESSWLTFWEPVGYAF